LLNIASNATYIASSALANLWLTPFLIGHLGIAAFGMIPLVTSITSYMSVLTTALDSALSRFLVIDLERGDARAANRTFNTTLFGLIGIILALSPIVLGVSLAFPTLFNVPAGWEVDASWLFVVVALTSFVTVIGSSFAVSPFIHSHFLLSNMVSFVGLLARIGLIVILFSLLPARLWYAGSGGLIAALVSLLGFVFLWRKLTPELHVQITKFDRSRLKSLTGMGGWVIVNTVGGMLLNRVDLVVVNAFFGAAVTGGYGSVVQFSMLMDYLATAVATVLRPIILIKYAQQDLMGLQRIASQSVKLLGLALALPVGLLCGFSRPLLSVWLGPEYQFLSVLLVIIVCHLSLNLSMRPLLYVQTAYNRIRWPGIVTLLCGGVSLGLAVLLGMWGKWEAAGVALAVAVAWTAKNALYVPIYTAHIMGLGWWSFLPTSIPIVTVTLLVGAAAYGLTQMRMPATWLELAGSATIISLLYVAGVWGIGLSPADRQLLGELLRWRTRQHSASTEQ
jgi:O-antigen/teichoic acid export membrane protein